MPQRRHNMFAHATAHVASIATVDAPPKYGSDGEAWVVPHRESFFIRNNKQLADYYDPSRKVGFF